MQILTKVYSKFYRLDEIDFEFYNIPVHRINYIDGKVSTINTINNKTFSFLTAKSKCWEYENEYRIIIDDDRLIKNPAEFDKTCLKGIIFGVDSKDEDIKLIKSICNNIYKNIKFYKVVIKKRQLKFKSIL